jgi:ubiquinone/menaquinone biosynthesis C-methylase UbiE
VFPEARIAAIDLNFSILTRADELARREPPLEFAVASLFDLPFPDQSFDLVYSEGVLHHTYSTQEAFRAIARKVSHGGHLFVWVYGRDDLATLHGRRRVGATGTVLIERLLRPAVSRAPNPIRDGFFAAATTAAHPVLKPRMRHTDSWERANTEHHLRDWLSPRYAHRHGFNEVAEWFENAGLEIVAMQSPSAYRRLFSEPMLGVGLLGRRSR